MRDKINNSKNRKFHSLGESRLLNFNSLTHNTRKFSEFSVPQNHKDFVGNKGCNKPHPKGRGVHCFSNSKKAQVWIETAIYSLIGITIIAIVLTAVMPQIEKTKDKAIITQTLAALKKIDSRISEIQESPGNIRIVYLQLSKGSLELDTLNDKLIYTLENTKLELSEAGQEIQEGNILLKTEEYGRNFNVILTVDYSDRLNLTYQGTDENRVLQPGTAEYKIKLDNPGDNDLLSKIHIDLDIL